MEVVEAETVSSKSLQRGRLNGSAEWRGGAKAEVVDQNDDDVRRPGRGRHRHTRRRRCIPNVEFRSSGRIRQLHRQDRAIELLGDGLQALQGPHTHHGNCETGFFAKHGVTFQ